MTNSPLNQTTTNQKINMVSPIWVIQGGKQIYTSTPYGIMGIINVTPDSFFDGDMAFSTKKSIGRALGLRRSGADILDIGAESSRPGAQALQDNEEISRLLPVLAGLKHCADACIISIDTYHAKTAAIALQQGASIINDISACRIEPELLDVLVSYKPGYILMHGQETVETLQKRNSQTDIRKDVMDFFEKKLNMLVKAGLPENRIVLDPGIGFGKSPRDNITLLTHAEEWKSFNRPILTGISMKSFFSALFNCKLEERASLTQIATALLHTKGVFWHRVHDVVQTQKTLEMSSLLTGLEKHA